KFTPVGGKVVIETRIAADATRALVSITDTGIGLEPPELERIFEAFVQGDHVGQRNRHFGGLGLGLAISKMLVDLHGGQISAASEGTGQGATFTVELPLTTA